MKLIFSFILSAFLLLFTVSTGFTYEWELDKAHSEIRFKVNHIHTHVSGGFNDFEGNISFDPASPETGKINFTVNVNSIDTNNGKRDNHLRSKDFFTASDFPEMKFQSTKISRIKDNLFALEGKMTIKDVSKDIRIEFLFFEPKPHPFDKKKNVAGFTTRFSLNRLDYGVGSGKFFKMGVVGKDVEVEIATETLTAK
ncbi:MAG: YceI family protein [Desulfobacterales bacterium]|nr:YceI family protein [Desulfobacterales bacterium]